MTDAPRDLPVAGARVLRAVEYARIPGFRPLLLDLHLPAGAQDAPVVLYIHGGGWRAGSRAAFGPAYTDWTVTPFAALTGAGLAVASVDYRLSGEARYPAQLEDVTAALGWLRERGATYGIDPGRVAVWGESAGGHLAALLALTTDPGDAPAAVVDWYGPTDLGALADDSATSGIAIIDPAADDSREALLLGAPPRDVPDRAAAAGPLTHVRPGAPPFLIVHGTADRFVPLVQSRRFADALAAHGVPVDLRALDGADHMWRDDPAAAREAFAVSRDFVLTHLRPAG